MASAGDVQRLVLMTAGGRGGRSSDVVGHIPSDSRTPDLHPSTASLSHFLCRSPPTPLASLLILCPRHVGASATSSWLASRPLGNASCQLRPPPNALLIFGSSSSSSGPTRPAPTRPRARGQRHPTSCRASFRSGRRTSSSSSRPPTISSSRSTRPSDEARAALSLRSMLPLRLSPPLSCRFRLCLRPCRPSPSSRPRRRGPSRPNTRTAARRATRRSTLRHRARSATTGRSSTASMLPSQFLAGRVRPSCAWAGEQAQSASLTLMFLACSLPDLPRG